MSALLQGLGMLLRHGVVLEADKEGILWQADRPLTAAEANWVKTHKPALLRELTVVRLDFETISPLDIKLGVPAYLRDPETAVLILVWSVGLGDTQVWWPGAPVPGDLLTAIENGSTIVSHGAFDRLVWAAKMVPLGWPAVPAARWSDTSARCRAYRAPAELKKAAKRLELDAQKDPKGRLLIKRATEAAKGGKPLTEEELAAFENYARTDLDVLRELDRVLPELSAQERAAYELTEVMNARGFPIGRRLASRLWKLWQAEDARLTEAMLRLIGLRPSQHKCLLAWLREHAVPAPANVQAETLSAWLDANPHADSLVRQVMRLRIEAANSSGTKLKTLLDCTTDDDPFARGALVWHGAHTGRWSGTVFQPQNMPKTTGQTLETLIGLLQPDGPVARSASVKQRIADCLRAVIMAIKGQRVVVADFSQIESRVLCWMAGQNDKLAAYRRGDDVYVITATSLHSGDRNLGKLMTLAAGFGGGPRMLLAKAPGFGVSLTEQEARRYIEDWRAANDAIVDFGHALYRTVRNVVESPAGTRMAVGDAYPRNLLIASHEFDDTLRITLPSGRQLVYHRPRIVPNEIYEWSFDLAYQQAGPGDWIEKRSWHGLLTENVVQAIAYDLLIDAMLRMHQANIYLIGTVHDEAIALAAEPQAELILQQMLAIMRVAPDWARDLPLAAEGYHNARYVKP
jgi:DNA polymerase